MLRVAAIFGFSAVLLLSCGYSLLVSAQVTESDTARKFDEFGKIHHCDLTARLDNVAVVSEEDPPGAEVHIIAYAPPGSSQGILKHIKDYLVMSRGLAAQRVKTTYGGRNSDLTLPKIEVWIVPQNAAPPEPQKHETNIETFKGLLADSLASDYIQIEPEEELMGPGIGDTTHSSFADILKRQKNAVGYVVVYSGEDATPGAWKRIALDQVDYLKKFNVDPDRVKMIFGGHKKETRRQLWILPKNAPAPLRDAGPELPMAKAVKVDDFYANTLGHTQNEANVFTRLKEILSTQKTVRAVVVVRLEGPSPQEDPVDGEPEPPSESEEPPFEAVGQREPADLTKLVEKWRVELANTYKIGADRFIVLFTTAPEFHESHLSLWIVPKGQPLPDPHEEEPAEEDSKKPGVPLFF